MSNWIPSFRRALATGAAMLLCGSAFAQEPVVVVQGTEADLPYTVIYPEALLPVDDGSTATLLTLRMPNAPLQCDVFSVVGGSPDWTAEAALENLDVAGVEATWSPDFPGFHIVSQQVTNFASGPALLYEGESDNSPLGVPLRIVHAEAVGNGRTYAIECLIDRNIADEARPMVDFLIANFSTRSDGECCIDPQAIEG
jgi:hypothetical protein